MLQEILDSLDYEKIEEDGKIGRSFSDIACRLGITIDDFLELYYDESTNLKHFYNRGMQKAINDVNTKIYELAKSGTDSAIKNYQKLRLQARCRNTIDSLKNL